jgi:16S rRNA (guanine527-N7)-methyltransferase
VERDLQPHRDPRSDRIVVHHLWIVSLQPRRSCGIGRRGSTQRLLDVGSGAGLPGLVIAAACPGMEVLCIDKVAKKTAFVTQAAASLGLHNVKALHVAVEAMTGPQFDVIASRALGNLTSW